MAMDEPAGTGTQTDGTQSNVAVVVGRVVGEVRCRELASGSTVRNLEVVADREGGERVPVAWYDARRPPAVVDGDAVVVVGRVRRRWFRAGGVSVSRTEVVASVVARAGSRRAESALARVGAELAAVVRGGRLDDG
jgi:single-strand DNA-binding protein